MHNDGGHPLISRPLMSARHDATQLILREPVVSFQEVVHSALTGKAEVVEASVIPGGPNEHPQECPSEAAASRGDGPRRC